MNVRKTHWDQGITFNAMHTAVNLRESAYEREYAAYCSGKKPLAAVVQSLRREYRMAERIMRGAS